jgi:iron(III) transport system substrate-binding protein
MIAAAAFAVALAPSTHAADLVVYSAGPKPLSSALVKGFTDETGIKVNIFESNSGKVMARYQAEKANPQVDVMISASWGHAITLDEKGELLPYLSPNAAKVPANLKTGTYAAQGAAAIAIAFNTKSGLPAPKEWADLTQPVYKDQVTMPDPAKSGSALTLVQGLASKGESVTWELFSQLSKNGMIVPGPNNAALNPVLQGARGVVFGAVDYIALGLMAKGESLEVVYPKSGTVLAPRPIMILKSARNPDAAKKFVDYVLSQAGQAMVAKRLILPARTDVAAKRPGWNDIKVIDFDYVKAAAMAPETKKKFADSIRN